MLENLETKINNNSQTFNNSKPKKPFWKRLPNWSFLATLLGIAGGLITLNNFIAERPSLSLGHPNIDLQNIIPTDNYKERLEEIEEKYSGYTEYKINSLIDRLEEIDPDAGTDLGSEEVAQSYQLFYEELDSIIRGFQESSQEDKIKYTTIANELRDIESGISLSQQPIALDVILNDLRSVESEYSSYTGQEVNSLIDKLEEVDSDLGNSSQIMVDFKAALAEAIRYFDDGPEGNSNLSTSSISNEDAESPENEGISGLVDELKMLQGEINNYQEAGHEKIYIELSVANQSRLKNLIRNKAMITFYSYSDYDSSKRISQISLPLKVVSDSTIVDDYGLRRVELESGDFTLLDQEKADSLRAAFKDGYQYILVVEDLHGKPWHVEGRVLNGFNTQPEDEQRLENESERILKKIVKR